MAGRFLGYAAGTARIRSTRRDLVSVIGLQRERQQPHMEPPAPQVIVKAPRPRGTAKSIADVSAVSEETFAVDAQEVDRRVGLLKAGRKKHSDVVIRQVKKLHDQLGHASRARLAIVLGDTGAAPNV